MPNWCHNTLLVRGEEADVFDWVRRVREPADRQSADGSPLFFSSLAPEPDDIGEGWYGWRIENWGTKWEPTFSPTPQTLGGEGIDEGHPDFHRAKGSAEYTFDTAWGPPLEWIEKASRVYPSLRLTIIYGEPGMDFGGRITVQDGEVVANEEGTADEYLNDDMMWF